MSNHHSNPEIRHRIRMSELLIKERSKQVEEKWLVILGLFKALVQCFVYILLALLYLLTF